MNKQELIYELKRLLAKPSEIEGSDYAYGHNYGIGRAITIAKQLDEQQAPINEPRKPVVPQFVADWIEWCKKHNVTLLGAMSPIDELGTAICDDKKVESLDASKWATRNQETFAKAWLYGYDIEKEKLYTVEIPTHGNPDHFVLRKHIDGRVCLDCYRSDNWRDYEFSQLTEAEIKKEHDWAWKYAEEVSNND